MILNGIFDVSGGDGGGAQGIQFTQPGGGGAGGAILMQAPQVQIQPIPERIDVRGGLGGDGAVDSEAGDGSPGFIRLESFQPIPQIRDGSGNPIEEAKVVPTGADLAAKYFNIGGADITDIFSVAEWQPGLTRPESQSGAQSCWFSDRDLPDPTNPAITLTNFFQLEFAEDDPIAQTLGWDLTFIHSDFPDPQSYRGENDLTGPGGASFETLFGNELDNAPMVVLFQGAHTTGVLDQPCSVILAGPDSPLVPGSLSGWVTHPSELTDFFPDGALAPNVFRFAVIWDQADPNFDKIVAIEDLTVTVTPK